MSLRLRFCATLNICQSPPALPCTYTLDEHEQVEIQRNEVMWRLQYVALARHEAAAP